MAQDDLPTLKKLKTKVAEATADSLIEIMKDVTNKTAKYRRQLRTRPCEDTRKELESVETELFGKIQGQIQALDPVKKHKDGAVWSFADVEEAEKQLTAALSLLVEAEIALAKNESMMQKLSTARANLTDFQEHL